MCFLCLRASLKGQARKTSCQLTFLKPLLREAPQRLLSFPCLPSHQNVTKHGRFSYFRQTSVGSSGFRASLKLETHKTRSPLTSPSYFHVISSSDSPTLGTAKCKNASPRNVSGLFCTRLLLLFLLCLGLPQTLLSAMLLSRRGKQPFLRPPLTGATQKLLPSSQDACTWLTSASLSLAWLPSAESFLFPWGNPSVLQILF